MDIIPLLPIRRVSGVGATQRCAPLNSHLDGYDKL